MTTPNHSHSIHTRQRKHAQFSEPAETDHKFELLIVIVGLLLMGTLGYLARGFFGNPSSSVMAVAGAGPTQHVEDVPGGEIRIPIQKVGSGKATFFDYRAFGSKLLRFFVIKSSDGVYRAALDACDVCYGAKKGYYQAGDSMICRKCGREFPSARVNEVTGGCNPIALPRAVDGDSLVIKAGELDTRASYF